MQDKNIHHLFKKFPRYINLGRANRNCFSLMAVMILFATYDGSIVGSECPFFRALLSQTIRVLINRGHTHVTPIPK